MRTLNLHAEGPEQERLKAYLEENASDALAEKINNGTPYEKDGKQLINKKDLPDFMVYATAQAKEMAKEKKKTGAVAVCVDGDIIIGWLMHYFEEDDIEGVLYTQDGERYKPEPKPIPKPTTPPKPYVPPKPPLPAQRSIFELMEAQDEGESSEDVEEEHEENVSDETPEDTIEEEAETVTEQEEPVEEEAPIETPQTKPISGLYAQYLDYQDAYPNAIIAMRIGDFYEVLGDDAVDIAKLLDLTLTSREVGLEKRIPLVGFPYHAAESYFNKIAAIKMLVAVETDGEIRALSAPNESVNIETGEVYKSKAKYDDERFIRLLRLIGNVEVR